MGDFTPCKTQNLNLFIYLFFHRGIRKKKSFSEFTGMGSLKIFFGKWQKTKGAQGRAYG